MSILPKTSHCLSTLNEDSTFAFFTAFTVNCLLVSSTRSLVLSLCLFPSSGVRISVLAFVRTPGGENTTDATCTVLLHNSAAFQHIPISAMLCMTHVLPTVPAQPTTHSHSPGQTHCAGQVHIEKINVWTSLYQFPCQNHRLCKPVKCATHWENGDFIS